VAIEHGLFFCHIAGKATGIYCKGLQLLPGSVWQGNRDFSLAAFLENTDYVKNKLHKCEKREPYQKSLIIVYAFYLSIRMTIDKCEAYILSASIVKNALIYLQMAKNISMVGAFKMNCFKMIYTYLFINQYVVNGNTQRNHWNGPGGMEAKTCSGIS